MFPSRKSKMVIKSFIIDEHKYEQRYGHEWLDSRNVPKRKSGEQHKYLSSLFLKEQIKGSSRPPQSPWFIPQWSVPQSEMVALSKSSFNKDSQWDYEVDMKEP